MDFAGNRILVRAGRIHPATEDRKKTAHHPGWRKVRHGGQSMMAGSHAHYKFQPEANSYKPDTRVGPGHHKPETVLHRPPLQEAVLPFLLFKPA
jgi:hypothetical protein